MADPYYKVLGGWMAGVERGNLVPNSADPATTWGSSATTVTSIDATVIKGAVDVGSQAFLLEDAAAGSLHSLHETITINSGQQYSLSCFAKPHATYGARAGLRYWEAGDQLMVFNINSGTVISNTGTGTPYSQQRGGGWWRLGVTWNVASIGAAQQLGIHTVGSGDNATYAYDAGQQQGFYFGGPKVEKGEVSAFRVTSGSAEAEALTVTQSLAQVYDQDVYAIRAKRRLADIINRLTVGDCTLILDNTYGQYVGSLQINQGLQISAVTDAGSEYFLFTGKVLRWNANPTLGRREVTIKALDRGDELRQQIQMPLSINTKISSLMVEVLDAASVPADKRSIGVLNDDVTFGYLDDQTAGSALHQIIQAGAHFLWIDGQGNVRAEPRHYDVRGATAVESLANFISYKTQYSDKKIINDMNVVSAPRREAVDVGTVAWIEDPILVPASQSVTFTVEHLDPDTLEKETPVNSFVTLVNSKDFFASTQVSFQGQDTTAQFSLTVTHYALQTEVVAFNASSFSSYINRFQLRGLPLQLLPTISTRTIVSSSQSVYGLRDMKLENDLIPTYFRAKDFGDFLTDRYSDPPQEITVGRKNAFPEVVQRELLDAIHITEASTGVASVFNVSAVEHVISFIRGLEHTNILSVELAFEKNWLILDDANFGKLDDRRLGA